MQEIVVLAAAGLEVEEWYAEGKAEKCNMFFLASRPLLRSGRKCRIALVA